VAKYQHDSLVVLAPPTSCKVYPFMLWWHCLGLS